MNMNQLRYFVEIVKSESFTKASKKLHISQSALSQQIILLEKELKYKIFERTKSSNSLTQKGRLLYSNSHELDTLYKKLLYQLDLSKISQETIISAGGTICTWVLPKIISKILQKRNDLNFIILEESSEDTFNNIILEKADLGISSEISIHNSIEFVSFFQDRVVPVKSKEMHLAMPHNTNFFKEKFILFQKGTNIRSLSDKIFEKNHYLNNIEIVMEIKNVSTLLSGLESKIGVGFISNLALNSKIHELSIKNSSIERKFYLFYKKNRKKELSEIIKLMNLAL